MLVSNFPEKQWEQSQRLLTIVKTLERLARVAVKDIVDTFEYFQMEGSGVKATLLDSSTGPDSTEPVILAELEAPVGKGRIRRQWGEADQQLVATLVVERRWADEYGKQVWQPVWEMHVPTKGTPFLAGPDGRRSDVHIDGVPVEGRSNVLIAAAQMLAYRMMAGPIRTA